MALTIRRGTTADHSLVARLFVELGVPDPPPTTAWYEQVMRPRVLVAREGDEGVGYAFWLVYGDLGHVVNVVVAPGARGRGVGRALMEAVRRACVDEGCARWYLNVKKDNAPAIALYERCGMAREGEMWAFGLPWEAVARLPVEAGAPTPYEPGPDEDADLARWPGLSAARVAVLRARPGVVLRAMREAGTPVAFAAYDAGRRTIVPLRVARPTLLRPLCESIGPIEGDRARLTLPVEGDPATVEAVRAAGGELHFVLDQMGGPIGA